MAPDDPLLLPPPPMLAENDAAMASPGDAKASADSSVPSSPLPAVAEPEAPDGGASLAAAEKVPHPGSAVPAPPLVFPVNANDPIWGGDPESFWSKFEEDVEAERKAAGAEDFLLGVARQLRENLAGGKTPMLAFDEHRTGAEEKFVQVDSLPQDEVVWFIGDLHGDLLSCLALISYIKNRETADGHPGAYKVCFLGDLVDDGPSDGELLARVLKWMLQARGRFAFVTGNHDEGIYRDEGSGAFRSTVSPSDFCDRLNSLPAGSAMHELAMAAIQFFRQAPRAILLPDGLLVAHGGVPHVDVQGELREPADFNKPHILMDFVWTRLHESARRKVPNRTTRGCSLGYEDFNAFCDRSGSVLGRPVRAMLRGHDHVPERFLVHESYRKHPVVTINAMSSKQRDVFGPWERKPVAVRWRGGQPLEIHQVEIPARLIARFHPRPSQESNAGEQDRASQTTAGTEGP